MTGISPHQAHDDQAGRVHAAYAGLLELLQAQGSLLERLEALTRGQGETIERADPAGVLSLLDARQAIVDALAEAAPRVEQAAAAWRGVEALAGARLAENVRTRLEAMGELARAIAGRDAAARAALQRRRDEIGEELSRLTTSRRAVGAYAPGKSPAASFQDAEG